MDELDVLVDLDESIEQEDEKAEIVLATITAVGTDGVQIQVDGTEEAGEKEYKVNSMQRFAVGDRVKIFKDSGTYLIEYKIGEPMADYPIPPGGSDGQVLTKDGANDYAVKWSSPHGVPSGGSTDQVLAKSSNDNYALKWMTLHGIPSGGAKNQVLAKSAATDYSVTWVDAGQGVPSGGSSGQMLTKKSNTNYDLQWSDAPHGIPSGGTTGQVLKKSSSTNYAVEWGAAPSPTALTNGGYTVTCASNGYLYPSSGNIALGASNAYWNGCYIKGAMRFGDSTYGNSIGFFGTTPTSKKTNITTSSSLANVIQALKDYGLF